MLLTPEMRVRCLCGSLVQAGREDAEEVKVSRCADCEERAQEAMEQMR